MSDGAVIERHDAGRPEDWAPSLDNARTLRRTILERTPRPSDGMELLAADRDRAGLLAMLGSPDTEVAEAIALGAGAGAAGAMAQAAAQGAVLLREPGSGGPRVIPAGEAGMNPLLWRDALMLALTARNREAGAVLRDPARIAACQLDPARADTFWPSCCEALASVVEGSADASRTVKTATAEMATVRIADPATVEALDRPLLRLALALAEGGDEAGWNDAVTAALAAHRDYYATPARRYDRSGFLAFGVLGLCALAHDRGLPTRVRSAYAPATLIDGSVVGPLSHVAFLAGGSRPGVEDEAAAIGVALAGEAALSMLLRPVLEALHCDMARGAAALRPREGDYEAVFAGAAAAAARAAYERFWRNPPPFPPRDPLRTELQIHLAPAGMLATDNILSRPFPQGYRAIARWLNPHCIWAAWSLVAPGGSGGLAYDGLVWCGDHWAWFPRPYQVLRDTLD
jgi:hypothetical protein